MWEISTVKRSVTTVVKAPWVKELSIVGVVSSVTVEATLGTSLAAGTSIAASWESTPTIAVWVIVFPFSSVDCVSSHLSQRINIVKNIAIKRKIFCVLMDVF